MFMPVFPCFKRGFQKGKGRENSPPCIFNLVQETSAWRRKLIYSVIVQESGKERHPCQADEEGVCLFIPVVVDGDLVCKNQETRTPLCFTKYGARNNCGCR